MGLFPCRILPSQTIAIDEDYATQNSPVIHALLAMALWKRVPYEPSARPSAGKGCSSVSLLAEAESRRGSKINGS